MLTRQEIARQPETPERNAAYDAKIKSDAAAARAAGWTNVHIVMICEPYDFAGTDPSDGKIHRIPDFNSTEGA